MYYETSAKLLGKSTNCTKFIIVLQTKYTKSKKKQKKQVGFFVEITKSSIISIIIHMINVFAWQLFSNCNEHHTTHIAFNLKRRYSSEKLQNSYLHNACGNDDIIGPYPWELSYSSNNGAATSLQFFGTANRATFVQREIKLRIS